MTIQKNKKSRGFTLIEVLIVIGLIAILATVALVAINPNRQFAQARNTERESNVTAIANAISQNMADNKGVFTCSTGVLPATSTEIKSGAGGYDIKTCIVPNYLADLPVDPTNGSILDPTSYSSGYEIVQDTTTKRITVSAPHAELAETISTTH